MMTSALEIFNALEQHLKEKFQVAKATTQKDLVIVSIVTLLYLNHQDQDHLFLKAQQAHIHLLKTHQEASIANRAQLNLPEILRQTPLKVLLKRIQPFQAMPCHYQVNWF